MAFLAFRSFPRLMCRSFSITTQHLAKKSEAAEFQTDFEKKLLETERVASDDVFHTRAVKRGPATKANPTLVPSYYEKRVIGCVCEEDSASVTWMWLHKGEPKQCECGFWFKLGEAKLP